MIRTLILWRSFPVSGSSSLSKFSLVSLMVWLNLSAWSWACRSKTWPLISSMRPLSFKLMIALGLHPFFFWGYPFPLMFFRVYPTFCIDPTWSVLGSSPIDPTGFETEVASPSPILNFPSELLYLSVATISLWRWVFTCFHTLLLDTRSLLCYTHGAGDSLGFLINSVESIHWHSGFHAETTTAFYPWCNRNNFVLDNKIENVLNWDYW